MPGIERQMRRGNGIRDWLLAMPMFVSAGLAWVAALPAAAQAGPGGEPNNAGVSPTSPESAVTQRLQRPALDFTLTKFGGREGAPTFVAAIAQSPDGFLWLAAEEGLFRFDGITFLRVGDTPKHHGSVSSVLAESNGDIWAGFRHGGVERLSQGTVASFDEGLPLRTVNSIERDPSGALWAGTSLGLYRLDGRRWIKVTPASDKPIHESMHLSRLRDGQLFAGMQPDKAWVWRNPKAVFEALNEHPAQRAIWGITPENMPATVSSEVEDALTLHSFLNGATAIDGSGAVWSYAPGPLVRYQGVANKQAFSREVLTPSDSKFRDTATAIFFDREGNVWVGQAEGVVRLSPNKLQAFAARDAVIAPSLAKSAPANLWITSRDQGEAFHLVNNQLADKHALGGAVNNVGVDRDGTAWFLVMKFHTDRSKVIDESSIEVWDGRVMTKIPFPDEVPGARAIGIVEGEHGDHLLASAAGAFRFDGHRWLAGFGYPGLPPGGAFRLIRDDRERIWIGYPDSTVALIDRGNAKVFDSRNGVDVGFIQAIEAKGDHAWIAGTNGVCLLVSQRCTPVTGAQGERFDGATGIIEAKSGDLWINAVSGVYRIAARELAQLQLGAMLKVDFFGPHDGLQGGNIDPMPGPTALEAQDGRLWFARNDGANWIDPLNMLRNTVAPVPVIDTLTADGEVFGGKAPRLRPHPHNLRIDYTAASLTMPERVTFQYRLEGVDATWQDAGPRRQAFYTDVDPGNYTFRVRATNEDGVASEREATLRFSVRPGFYQTWWFKLIVAACLALLLGLLYRLRLAQMHSRLRLQLEAKHDERERIARDLHDTLMQGVHGIVLQLDVWATDSKMDPDHRQNLARVANAAYGLLTEGRDKIVALRTSSSGTLDLATRLEEVARECSMFDQVNFALQQSGSICALSPEAGEEIFQVGREALKNAFVHAKATTIVVNIVYGQKTFTLSVKDDGQGLPPAVEATGSKPLHWGLSGMRERTKNIEGQLTIRSLGGRGTVIELSVPSRVAYA